MEEGKVPRLLRPSSEPESNSSESNYVSIIEDKQTPDTCFQPAEVSELELQQCFKYRSHTNSRYLLLAAEASSWSRASELESALSSSDSYGSEQVCKQIWLGLFDDRSSAIPDFRDPQKVKEFLQEKYEKKRWYVPPEQAKVVASVHASISGSSASSTSSTPEVKPLKSLLGDSAAALHLNKGTPSQSPVVGRSQGQQQEKKFDLLSDLGSDIFAAPASQSSATANFANFAHFNSHAVGVNKKQNKKKAWELQSPGGLVSLKTAISSSPRLARHPSGDPPPEGVGSLKTARSSSPRLARHPSGDPHPEGVGSLKTARSSSPRLARHPSGDPPPEGVGSLKTARSSSPRLARHPSGTPTLIQNTVQGKPVGPHPCTRPLFYIVKG
ncbi:Arf-GAP domain and FG repeat-containing protein 1 [Myotis davidii]|uniref:Arf-GAP domain and FG repeat-containing protein 1 n=1 Tax=Myotis davidii TaxID=225400 RepID=L5M1P3_MYODS|nr:Arf-GAP domain and FG repeat-containing protein 1 [Myotis davidii]